MNVYFVVGTIFVILKLCGLISWSWVWVLSPFIAYLAVLFVSLFAVMTHHKRVCDLMHECLLVATDLNNV